MGSYFTRDDIFKVNGEVVHDFTMGVTCNYCQHKLDPCHAAPSWWNARERARQHILLCEKCGSSDLVFANTIEVKQRPYCILGKEGTITPDFVDFKPALLRMNQATVQLRGPG